MAVKDGSGPRPAAHTAKRCFLNCLETIASNLAFSCRQLGSKDPVAGLKHHGNEGRIGPAAGSPYCQTLLSELPRNYSFKPCCFLASARVQDPVAGLKHHGSEGRIGPAAGSPYCQTLLSELPRNYSFKPCFFLPSARVQGPCRRLQTPWQ